MSGAAVGSALHRMCPRTTAIWHALAAAGSSGLLSSAIYEKFELEWGTEQVNTSLQNLKFLGYVDREGPFRKSVWLIGSACKTPRGCQRPAWLAAPDENVDDEKPMGCVPAGTTPVAMPAAPASIFNAGELHIEFEKPAGRRPKLDADVAAPASEAVVLGWKAAGFSLRPEADAPHAQAYFAPHLAPEPAPIATEPKFQCSIDNEGFFNLFLDDTEIVLPPDLTRKLVRYVECLGSALMASLEGAAA